VQGGDATNVVMSSVTLQAEARSHDSGFRQRIVAEFRKAFEKSVRKLKSSTGRAGQLRLVEDVRYQAFQIPPDSPCVQAAAESLTRLQVEPEIRLSDGGLDANWMMEHGFPTVTMGCGQHQIHTVDETLSIPEYLTACRMALSLATASR
jgi:tripeptide aminopeptidase